MLYERWCQVAARRPHDVALRDSATRRQWTFAELHAAGEAHDPGEGENVCPQGNTPEFVLALLCAWRSGRTACPIEPGQTQLSPAAGLPPDIVHLKMTSATTGAARYVAFKAGQLAADAENIVATMGLRADWPNLGVISLAHSYGFSNLVLPLLLHGIPLILVQSPLPEAVRQAAAREKSVTLPGVPTLWRAWLDAGAIPPNVKLAISAGAPLPLGLEQEIFKKCGLRIHNFYGSTECGGIAYDPSELPRDDDACVGSPMQNVNLSLNDNSCLVVRSRAVGEGYWPVTLETLGRGQFETADFVELKDNKVFLRGRASDLINVAGRKVSPLIIERVLLQHPFVSECLVFGVPDRDSTRGDSIVACVVASSALTGDSLKQFLQEQIPAWQVPRHWIFVESLLPNRVGKVSRAEWRERWLAGTVE